MDGRREGEGGGRDGGRGDVREEGRGKDMIRRRDG